MEKFAYGLRRHDDNMAPSKIVVKPLNSSWVTENGCDVFV